MKKTDVHILVWRAYHWGKNEKNKKNNVHILVRARRFLHPYLDETKNNNNQLLVIGES